VRKGNGEQDETEFAFLSHVPLLHCKGNMAIFSGAGPLRNGYEQADLLAHLYHREHMREFDTIN